jgi:hypothetical protein
VRSSVPVVEITDQVDGFASGAAGKGEGDAGDSFTLGFYEGFLDHFQAPWNIPLDCGGHTIVAKCVFIHNIP